MLHLVLQCDTIQATILGFLARSRNSSPPVGKRLDELPHVEGGPLHAPEVARLGHGRVQGRPGLYPAVGPRHVAVEAVGHRPVEEAWTENRLGFSAAVLLFSLPVCIALPFSVLMLPEARGLSMRKKTYLWWGFLAAGLLNLQKYSRRRFFLKKNSFFQPCPVKKHRVEVCGGAPEQAAVVGGVAVGDGAPVLDEGLPAVAAQVVVGQVEVGVVEQDLLVGVEARVFSVLRGIRRGC